MAEFTILDRVGEDLVVGTDTGVTGIISEPLMQELGLVPDKGIRIHQVPDNHRVDEWRIIVFDKPRPIDADIPPPPIGPEYRNVSIPLVLWALGRLRWRLGWNKYERTWHIQHLPPWPAAPYPQGVAEIEDSKPWREC